MASNIAERRIRFFLESGMRDQVSRFVNDKRARVSRFVNDKDNQNDARGHLKSAGMGLAGGATLGAAGSYGRHKIRMAARNDVLGELEKERLNPSGDDNPITRKIKTKHAIPELQRTIKDRMPDNTPFNQIGKTALKGAAVGAALSVPAYQLYKRYGRRDK